MHFVYNAIAGYLFNIQQRDPQLIVESEPHPEFDFCQYLDVVWIPQEVVGPVAECKIGQGTSNLK